ncbi:uncharacterized protein LOC100374895 [Saccoglossus kowalevskii]|uniref:Uncharacterized protein LOC100374895 n=1 Tax=Saccoglossus kowalevskii TaxID=10224 RepID=A0ABM0GYK9_SACKO|nr:PREDICTED: uncharacterized protein LOC100374895 [Saccoglossus kowalevskii]
MAHIRYKRSTWCMFLGTLLVLWCSIGFFALFNFVWRNPSSYSNEFVRNELATSFRGKQYILEQMQEVHGKEMKTLIDRYPWLYRKNFVPNHYTKREWVETAQTPVSDDSNFTIVFVHNQKSGGTSIKECIDKITTRMSFPSYVGIYDDIRPKRTISDMIGRVETMAKSNHPKMPKFFVSENTFGLCDVLDDRPCSYFTLMRDPYDRIVSSYQFCKYQLDDPLCCATDARFLSIKEWALHQGSYFFRQLQFNTIDICSPEAYRELIRPRMDRVNYKGRDANKPPCWYKHKVLLESMDEADQKIILEYILANLETWFSVVGVTEHFDEFLRLLEHTYGLPFHKECSGHLAMKTEYSTWLQGRMRSDLMAARKKELMEDKEIQRALYYDVKIYEKLQEIYQAQKEHLEKLGEWK